MLANMFFNLPDMAGSPRCCNNHKFRSFTRNTCNRFVDSFQILFGASSQAYSVTVFVPFFYFSRNAYLVQFITVNTTFSAVYSMPTQYESGRHLWAPQNLPPRKPRTKSAHRQERVRADRPPIQDEA